MSDENPLPDIHSLNMFIIIIIKIIIFLNACPICGASCKPSDTVIFNCH